MLALLASATLAGCAGEEPDQEASVPGPDVQATPQADLQESVGPAGPPAKDVQGTVVRAGDAFAYSWDVEAAFMVRAISDGTTVFEDSASETYTDQRSVLQILREAHIEGEDHGLGAMFGVLPDALAATEEPIVVDAPMPVAVRERDLLMLAGEVVWPAGCRLDCDEPPQAVAFPSAGDMVFLEFPLSTGQAWTSRIDLGEQPVLPRFAEQSFVVGPLESVTVPHGTFEAVRVDSLLRVDASPDHLEAAAEDAEDYGFEDVEVTMYVELAMTHWYAPQAGAVVLERGRLTSAETMTFTEDGTPGAIEVALEATMENRLDGLAHDAIGSLSEQAYVDVFDTASRLGITADRTSVNVAEDGNVSFRVEAKPVYGSDPRLTTTVRGWQGQLAVYEGAAFTHGFTEPGAYTATAYLEDGGVVVAARSVTVVAGYEASFPLDCEDVTVGAVASCAAVAVPARPGAASVEVRVEGATSAGVADTPGTLTLSDGADGESGAEGTGSATVTVDAFDVFVLGADDWTATWTPTAAVLGEGTVSVEVRYAAVPGGGNGEGGGNGGFLSAFHLRLDGVLERVRAADVLSALP